MNEQDMIIKQKIEKRERVDTIIAYVMMGILVVGIGIVLYLKFVRKDEVVEPPEEYVPNYISLNEISDSLNRSTLANLYMNSDVNFNSSVSDNSLIVSYDKEDVELDLDILMVGSELRFTMDEENNDIITDIYKEIGNIICMYYGNEERYCRNTLNNLDSDDVDGIRFVNKNDTNYMYMIYTRSFAVNTDIVYDSVTKVSISDTDYVLNLSDVKVSNINVVTSGTNILFTGNVDRLTDDSSDVTVLIKLYDMEGNIIGENKYEYNKENVLENTGTFEIKFLFNNSLSMDNLDKYSIEIVKQGE